MKKAHQVSVEIEGETHYVMTTTMWYLAQKAHNLLKDLIKDPEVQIHLLEIDVAENPDEVEYLLDAAVDDLIEAIGGETPEVEESQETGIAVIDGITGKVEVVQSSASTFREERNTKASDALAALRAGTPVTSTDRPALPNMGATLPGMQGYPGTGGLSDEEMAFLCAYGGC